MKSRSGRLLAVRRVTQDNQGKKTAGIDGVKSLTPKQRLNLSKTLKVEGKASPVRRVEIPKPGTDGETETWGFPLCATARPRPWSNKRSNRNGKRGLNPTAMVFAPAARVMMRSMLSFAQSAYRQSLACDADIAKCFDHIAHEPLLDKMQTSPTLRRQIRAWLTAGVMDHGELFPTEIGKSARRVHLAVTGQYRTAWNGERT